MLAGFAQGFQVMRIAVQRHHRAGSGGKLDFGHAVERPPEPVPAIGRDAVIEHGAAVCAQLNVTAGAVGVKTVAHQGQHHVGVGQLCHVFGVGFAVTAKQGGGQRRVQGRDFEFVAHGAGCAVLPLKVVRINRLRGAVKRIDRRRKLRRREVDQVQKRTLAHSPVRVGRL